MKDLPLVLDYLIEACSVEPEMDGLLSLLETLDLRFRLENQVS